MKHVYFFLTSPVYRQVCRYYSQFSHAERFVERSIVLSVDSDKQQVCVPDAASFVSQYEEIFYNKIYDLPSEPKKVLDLGANIGLSVLWMKRRFPASEIMAIEADPKIFTYLKSNTRPCQGVTLRNVAVWDEPSELYFQSEGADGGRVNSDGSDGVRVEAVDIRSILQEEGPFEFIKMDIEGAESRVLPACRGYLAGTKYVFCEYHSVVGEAQALANILTLLKDEGFRIHIQPVHMSKQPFMERIVSCGFDMQLNIFAWK